jgi:hypothetical protein
MKLRAHGSGIAFIHIQSNGHEMQEPDDKTAFHACHENCISAYFSVRALDLRRIPWYYTEDPSYGKEATMQQAMRSMDHTGVADTPQFHPDSHSRHSVLPEPIKASLFAKWQDASLSFFLCNSRETAIHEDLNAPSCEPGHCPAIFNCQGVDA